MAIQYGLRRSEIVGLKWRAVNFEEDIISIVSTVTEAHIDGERILICKDKTKSIAGMRSFNLTSGIYEANINVKDIQTFLGHSSAKTTMDIYVHLQNKTNTTTVSAITEKINI